MAITSQGPALVWWFDDGRPGHRQQSLALVDALQRQLPINARAVTPVARLAALRGLLGGRYRHATSEVPELLVGCGHATHLDLLASRQRFACPAVVLMRPSLPLGWFDFCIAPAHDRLPERANCLSTEGALCRIPRGRAGTECELGLFLIGGPSRHCHWEPASLIRQILHIVEASRRQHWQLSTSPRTPAAFLPALQQAVSDAGLDRRISLQDFNQLPGNWLESRLAECREAWISPDSASMVYQALTAGVACGLLSMPAKAGSRVLAGLQRMQQQGRVLTYEYWLRGQALQAPEPPLREAERAANWLLRQLGWKS